MVNSAIEIIIFVAGIILGVAINYAIYAWAYFSRPIVPWQVRPSDLPPLSRVAYVPVIGWLVRRGEASKWGRGFWIRPLLIEALVPILLLLLYRAMMGGLTIPLAIRAADFGGVATGGGVTGWELRVQFLAYSVMLSLLTIAAFIDIDERMIPDAITIPGTCIGLLASAFFSGWTLWEVPPSQPMNFVKVLAPMHANSPYLWNPTWGQIGIQGLGFWIGCLIWWVWCASLANLRWITRRGLRKAFVYWWVGFCRSPNLRLVLTMGLVGTLLIGAAYLWLPALRWQQFFSSLMGMGLGGLLVWSFRIVAGWVMGQEALGFGDVTLMAMVGANFGWQIVLIAFFLAPLFGIVLVITYWVITRDTAIPFGPYLATATAYLMLDWGRVWDLISIVFIPLSSFPLFLVVLLFLLGSLLWAVRSLRLLLSGG